VPSYRLDLAYDGSGFRGYARQPQVRTVQGVLEDALFKMTGDVATTVAGRTDAGVHARRQVVGFTYGDAPLPVRMQRSLNSMLAPEIVVGSLYRVPDDFHARFSATERRYRYQILSTPVPDPFRRHTTWHRPEAMDVDAMNLAAAGFVGEHDFASLCRAAPRRTTVRTVRAARWSAAGDLVVFEVAGVAFCHQMVRAMVAVSVEVGRGRLDPASIPEILAARDRNAARGAAPPHGLTLWDITYPDRYCGP